MWIQSDFFFNFFFLNIVFGNVHTEAQQFFLCLAISSLYAGACFPSQGGSLSSEQEKGQIDKFKSSEIPRLAESLGVPHIISLQFSLEPAKQALTSS